MLFDVVPIQIQRVHARSIFLWLSSSNSVHQVEHIVCSDVGPSPDNYFSGAISTFLVRIKGCHALKRSLCSYSNSEQQCSTVHKTQNDRWSQASGGTGAGGLIGSASIV